MKKIVIFLITFFCCIFGFLYFSYSFEYNIENTSSQDENTTEQEIQQNVTNEVSDIIVVELPSEPDYEADLYEGVFELPLNGSTGFASISMPLYKTIPSTDEDETPSIIKNLTPR